MLEYFEKEKEQGGSLLPLSCVQERVANALKISINTVRNVKSRSANNPVLSSPGKKRPRKKVKTEDLPEPTKMNIRNTLYAMYSQKKHVTVKFLNAKLQENHILISNSSLNRVLHDIGFKFIKDNNRRALVEKPHIAEMRLQFLKRYIENLDSPLQREVVFIDETWIYSKGSTCRSWQDENVKSVRKPEGYDGKRFIVVHAGSVSGFVSNASLLFASKSRQEDYHGEMFIKWIKEYLINNLEKPSLIILDNASYHSMLVEKMPSSSWPKTNIIAYLNEKNIPFDPTSFKLELLKLAKHYRTDKCYQVDEIFRSHGHEVLRLPPYHCEFNAIEMIWAHAKSYYNKHIGRDGYGDDKVIAMWKEALSQCTEEIWKNCVQHTEKIIRSWYERERQFDLSVEEFVINLDDENNSSESSSDYDSG